MAKRILYELLVAATILAVITTPLINPMIYSIQQTSDNGNTEAGATCFSPGGAYDFWAPKRRDTTPPANITDLAAGSPTNNSITLTWTAPGDDDMNGNATGYILKHSTTGVITASNWTHATTYNQSWTPAMNGTTETHLITGLTNGTKYWFAIEAYDDGNPQPNYSSISNSPSSTTTTGTNTGILGDTSLIIIVGVVAAVAIVIIAAAVIMNTRKHHN